jgi:hypothetical protein
MKIPGLPTDLTKITSTQYRAAVCHLARKPLDELRKQHRAIRKREQRARREKDRAALDQLYTLERIAADALFEREFGPAICRRPRRK